MCIHADTNIQRSFKTPKWMEIHRKYVTFLHDTQHMRTPLTITLFVLPGPVMAKPKIEVIFRLAQDPDIRLRIVVRIRPKKTLFSHGEPVSKPSDLGREPLVRTYAKIDMVHRILFEVATSGHGRKKYSTY